MGRKRDRANRDKPKGVYRKRGNWIFREYQGVIDGRAQFGPDVVLCPTSAPLSELHRRYEEVTSTDARGTVAWLLKQYHQSAQFDALKERTRDDYANYRRLVTGYTMANGRTFGEAPLDRVKRTTIRGYLDKYGAPIAANRHIQYLKAAWNWALERFDWIPDNPCAGVRLNTQTPRERYVDQAEFLAFKATTARYIPLFMELAYLCRARWSEVAALQVSDLLPEGIRLARGKGSEGEITLWTPRLRAAVDACQAYNPKAPSPIAGSYLIHDHNGDPISRNAFQSAWGRHMRAWVAAGNERFTFHDLKAAGYSDQKEQFAGHKDTSGKMHRTYNRKLRIVEPPK